MNGKYHDEQQRLSVEQWCARFEQWASSHRALPQVADDSRESIYAGRDSGDTERECDSGCDDADTEQPCRHKEERGPSGVG